MAFTPKVQRQIITDNLQMQSRSVSATLEGRLSHLSVLSRVLCESLNEVSLQSILHLADEEPLLTRTSPLHKEALPQHAGVLAGGLSLLTRWDKVRLCEYLGEHMTQKFGEISLALFFPCGGEISRVAYMPSGFTEEAFDIFSLSLQEAKVLHCEDYEASCMAVMVGDADACILPYRDAQGAYVRMTQGYLEAYGLYVTALYTVYDGEDEGIEYALCSKTLSLPTGGYHLHLRIPQISPRQVEEVVGSMGLFDLTPTQMIYACDKMSIWLSGKTHLLPIFLWLTLFAGGYEVGGLQNDSF